MPSTSLSNNLTLQILSKAEKEGYGILAQTCYDAHSVIGLVRAAERSRSPAILQLFPITLAYGKGPFLQFCLNAAHGASVPIAVHLDHATDPEHIELALSLAEQGIAFDSIMVDASHADTDEENIALARPHVERAAKCGVLVEVELGRLEGGEAGLRMISDAKLTNPEKADHFMKQTGALILSPSIGNLHGSYINPPNFRQDILKDLHTRFAGEVPLCLHGTDELPDELFKECIKNGISKINVNSWARDPYAKTLAAGLQSKPFPDAVEEATEVFAKVCDRFFVLFESKDKA
ncbi:aldolase [Stereum hirsutum FP-91666 SS1]|uniref:aldolase n=1 Tax=Stereum hirsutum (strain FP-91666) TaxID=721885 RepID=UPI0004449903|nr:aldolase [Stereum hirsutum FP-91666 SS1]EIM86071.1 aldolase [Stereum hirsutum FP-91666 SS1]